ncbi:hypothetical protein [Kutzneria chonburiensis]|uniref:RING-type E3 ubiquitin transferase n=1 Tax=Kutzneria chonburiensis TaxID=1483604 RepID=A0ABV6MJP0_9PSEU|nr:hypothetical protein [Kutzneria chonburiensis]
MNLSDIVGILGLTLSVIGIPLAVILARRGRKRPVLRYVTDFDPIAGPEDGFLSEGLLRSSSEIPIKRISRTYLAVWNHQGDTVRGADILPGDKLRMQLCDDDSFLQARIVAHSRTQNELSVAQDPNEASSVVVGFDFLDSGDGCVVELIHQGSDAPLIVGTIRGAELENRGGAALDRESLIIVSKSLRERLRNRFRGFWVAVILFPFVTVGVFTFGILLPIISQPATLVDVNRFNLRTLDGQTEFARQVDATSSGGSLLISIAAFLLVISLFACFTLLWVSVKAKIPKSVVRNIVFSDETGSSSKESTTSQPQ